jgi:hypothetical protein
MAGVKGAVIEELLPIWSEEYLELLFSKYLSAIPHWDVDFGGSGSKHFYVKRIKIYKKMEIFIQKKE